MADIFSDVLNIAGGILNQAVTGDNLADRKHASKLFVADNFRLVPKFGFLYHVFIDLNTQVVRPDPQNPDPARFDELGMMAKSVGLPTFSLDVKKLNAYNRPNLVQGKITYNPISISFHDDSSNVVRNFWYDYYNYHYRDSDYPEEMYKINHKYQAERPTNKWGYSPRESLAPRYINSIRIYSLSRKNFSEYVLINPVIKSFNHGEHQAGSNDTMTHTMSVDFETVLYYYGKVGPNIVKGFADLHYDKTPSPLSVAGGGTRSVLGEGGVLEQADNILYDLATGNYGSAAFKAGRLVKNVKNMDLGRAAIGDILQVGQGVLRGNNPTNGIFVPSIPGIGGNLGTVGGKIGGLFGGIGSGGGAGGGWLAGAAGLGIAALAGSGKRSTEMTDATSYIDQAYPSTPYDELPSPTEEDVLMAGSSESNAIGGEPTMNDSANVASAGSQGKLDATARFALLENNITVSEQTLQANDATVNNIKSQLSSIDATVDSLAAKRQALISAGATPSDLAIRGLDSQINQQNSIRSATESRMTEINISMSKLREKISGMKSEQEGL